MPHVSPTLAGFRAAFRRPSLTFAEIAWRWAVGSSATVLFIFYGIEYLDTLPVSSADAWLLSTRQPALVGRAIEHILRGSLPRAVFAALVAALALSLFWIVASSFGRLATTRALLDYFRRDVAEDDSSNHNSKLTDVPRPRPIRSLLDLNFLRLAVILAAALALAGAGILVSFLSTRATPRPGLAFTVFLPIAALVLLAAWTLNWWLSLAAVLAVRDGETALGSLSAAVTCYREHAGAISAVSTWTGLAHLVALSVFGTAASLPLAFLQIAPSGLIIAGVILATLLYLAVADWLYIARLAGYVFIAEMPNALVETTPSPILIAPFEALALPTAVDRDEPILSDVSNMAAET
jgi:hypothetical protein